MHQKNIQHLLAKAGKEKPLGLPCRWDPQRHRIWYFPTISMLEQHCMSRSLSPKDNLDFQTVLSVRSPSVATARKQMSQDSDGFIQHIEGNKA